MRANVAFASVALGGLVVVAASNCGDTCPPRGQRSTYTLTGPCASGTWTVQTVACAPPPSGAQNPGAPGFLYRDAVSNAQGVPTGTGGVFLGEAFLADGATFPLSDGGVPLGPDGGPAHYRHCARITAAHAESATFRCESFAGPCTSLDAGCAVIDSCEVTAPRTDAVALPYEP